MFERPSFILPQASSFAGRVDAVFWGITLICFVFALLVTIAVIGFTVRYRRGNRVNRTLPEHEGVALELTWTIVPLIIALGIFVWSTSVYFTIIRPPKDSMNIYVVGKQWMWKLQHPTGKWEQNELHVPLGRPIKLTMISEDVIHSFGIPAMRAKQDVIPGRYTELWFEPTQLGKFHIFCSQFCGTNHAVMGGYVTVMEPAEFEKWQSQGNTNPTLASAGERLFRELGCTGCHGGNASVRAPNLEGIYNKPAAIQVGDDPTKTTVVKADDRYIHDSIVLPKAEIAAGYQNIMPSYAGRVSEEELVQLIEYIKTLGTSNGTSNAAAKAYNMSGSSQGSASAGEGGANGSPMGDMSNSLDRETVYGGSGVPGLGGGDKGSPTGDMSNRLDRDAIMRSGRTPSSGAIVDNSAGGANPEINQRPGLQQPYRSNNYINDSARVYTGGLTAGNTAGATTKAGAARTNAGRTNGRGGNPRSGNAPGAAVQGSAATRERTGR